ncbi:hypothetical protein [Variovorax rhizosphaerae]|uniref:Pentapeptide MXKDX repeat protein n=1 Tax=Variovorax rhizosphaerae TaxID=1836200 RepID=A0ABU8WM87_9BURK
MTKVTAALFAICFGFTSASAMAQAVAPPAGGSSGKGSAVAPPNPTSGSSKDTKPMSDHPAVNKDGTGTSADNTAPEPTAKDSMAKDNMPKHPAAKEGTKASTSK